MLSSSQIKGVLSYITKLTHTVGEFRIKLINVSVKNVDKHSGKSVEFEYDLEVTSKKPDTPYLWDFFECKSKQIIDEGSGIVSVDSSLIHKTIKTIYYNGNELKRYSGYIPKWFKTKIENKINQNSVKQLKTHFYCKGLVKVLTLNVDYEVTDIYPSDGFVMDVNIYANQVLVDNEPIEGITPDIADTISGYAQDLDEHKKSLDDIFWTEITKYMDLSDCDIWTHTYSYVVNIGDVEIDSSDYTSHSTFSSKLCDFISGN